MYALESLTPGDAPAFAPLALATLRPALARLAALPSVTGIGASLFGRPVGLALAVTPPAADSARLLSLFVVPNARRAKIASALLRRLGEVLRARGVNTLEALVPSDGVGSTALEVLFSSLGWSGPTLDALRCVAEHRTMLAAPWLVANRECPAGYDIVSWVDVTEDEREAVRARQATCSWFPSDLDPFHHERELDVDTSVALRHGGDVVGWMITHRMTPTALSYTCGFVRHDLARRGRFIPLLAAALEREVATAPHVEHLGIWSTPAHHEAMIRFERTHMAPFSREVVETRRYAVRLLDDCSGSRAQAVRRPGVPLVPPARLTIADRQDCLAIGDAVRNACAEWPRLSGALDIRRADDASARGLLASVVPSIANALSAFLCAKVETNGELPAASLFVVAANRLSRLPLAPLSAPASGRCIPSSSRTPLVVTLPLVVPAGGAAWLCWALTDEETIGLTDVEVHALLDAREQSTCEMQAGVMLAQDAHGYRQLATLPCAQQGELLVLVQAIAEWTDGMGWVLHA